MKSMRLYLYITLGAFLALFIVGTFVDLQLSNAIFSDKNTFGLVVSIIGTTPGYGMFAILGGGFLSLFLKKEVYQKSARVLFILATIVCIGASTYFAGREFFGPNGFYWVASSFWGYLISLPCMVGFTYLGYILFKRNNNKDLWILLITLIICFAVALTAGVTLIKVIFHRPRFRAVMAYDEIRYLPWYTRCTNYEGLMKTYGMTSSEEFKSFPSGHSASIMGLPVMTVFLPVVDEKFKKYRLPLFICGLVFALLVMFSRILVGAHYLSDVSMGAILTTLCIVLGFEILRASKKFNFNY